MRAKKVMKTVGYVQLTVKIAREDDCWVATCEELGVSTCDDSLDAILEEIRALISQHLNALERNGVRPAFFKKHGIQIHRGVAAPAARPVSLPVPPGVLVTRVTERLPVAAGKWGA